MKKLFLLFFAVLLCLVQSNLLAQNGPGTPSFFNAPTTSTSGNAFPLNSTTSNKVQWIYGPGTFTSDGTATGSPVGAGNNITKIFIRMSSTFNASTIYSPNFEISLKQTGTHNKHPDATFVTGMTSVYQSSAFQFTGISANTWYGITLQTPFTYDPSQNLIVEMKSNLASAGGNTIVGIASTGNERIYGGYAATSGTAGTILAYMGLAVTPNGPCTSPPIAGIASASVTNGCSGVPFNLSLSGYSTGSGQTYQWDSSANGTTWFPMPGDTTPSIVQTQVSSCYYRCRVTCSGLTTNSSPTSLIVTPALVSGNFTINSGIATGGNNFQSFTDAISYISCGVNGPVNFTVVPGTGPYVGQISIPAIPGASGTKRITFKGNNETIQFTAPDANNRTAITLNGADFITFDSLNIDVSAGATYGYGIVLMNAADSNIIRNCNINNNTSSTTAANYIGIMINGSNVGTGTSGNNGNGNIIENNVIIGGGYSMYVYGSTSPYNKGNVIRKNLVKDFYSYGIYCYGNDSLTISKNEITRPTRTTATTTYGIYPSSCTNLLVEKNRIHNLWDAISTSTSTTYPIYIASAGLSAANPNKLENNLIYTCSNSGGAIYGIYALSYSYVNYYHNTIVIDNPNSTAGTTYGMYTYGTSGVNLRNNIVHIGRAGTGTKYCIYFSTTAPAICNNNVLYNNSSAGTNGIVYLSSAYTTLSAWQASNANAFDQQSLSLDPLYVSPPTGDFTPSDFSIYTVGVNVGVTTDINDSSRIAYNPGAFRMVAAGCSGTPIPGTVVVASTNVCANTNFSLNLNGNSIGTGLTFTWERSKNGTSAWTAVSTALTSPSFTTQQDTSYYYRCKVQCNSGTPQYSNIVQLVSPLLVNGNFTINSAIATGGNNFQNFADAISYISCGINGPVTFTVTSGSGPYTSQLSIPAITGTSSINRVVFKGNGETISYNAPDATNRTALTLDGADFITIDSFVIDVSASTFAGWGIVLKNQADSNIIRNCTVNTSLTATTSNYAGILINGSNTTTSAAGNNGNGNLIEKNTINGGYYGIFNYGNSAGYNKNNTFRKNKILDFYYYGFYNYYNDSITISKNEFARPTRSSIGGGYVIYNVSNTHLLIEKNSIHNLYDAVSSSTTANYLIYNSCTGFSASEPNRIENNIMYNINSSGGSIYGIYSLGYNYNNYYHNTILLDDQNSTAGTTYAMYAYGTGVNVRNNIINVSRAGTGTKYCMYFSTTAPAICNNNILNMTSTAGTNNLVYLSSAFADLAAWQASNANAFDQQSYSLDPVFINVSTGDLTPTSSLVDNKGAAVGVLQDIRDSIRSTSTPDIGAFEFSTLTAGVNMGAQSLVTPSVSTTGCYSNAETITIKIRNSSTGTHNFATNPVTVNVSVTGTVTVNLSKIVNTGTLQSDSTLNVTMSTPLNMSIAGTYTFNASTTVTGDANPANDAMVPVNRTKVVVNGGSPTSTPPSYCITSGTPTLNAVNAAGYSSLKWQQSTTSGSGYTNIPGATTSPYTVSSAITQSMYYRVIAYCSVDSSISNEVTVALNNPSVVSKTDSSRCGTGVVTLKATGSSGSLLSWYTTSTGGTSIGSGSPFTTPSISSTTTYYVGANNGGSTAYVGPANLSIGSSAVVGTYYLNFTVTSSLSIQTVDCYFNTIGSNFTLNIRDAGTLASVFSYSGTTTVSGTTTPQVIPINATLTPGNYQMGWTTDPGTYRVSTGASYPYTIPGVVSITGNTFNDPNYYYYFFNWQVSTGCESARTAVVATVNANPSAVAVSPNSFTQCTNSPAKKLTATGGVGAGTYVWTPTTGLYTDAAATTAYLANSGKDSVFAQPGSTTKYTATSTNTNNCSSMDTSNIIVNCTLPVSYLNFAGVREAGNNVLRWTTSTEQNNKGFDVERSVDGRTFSSLGFVASKADNNNSNHELSYNFIDNQLTASVYYYRLRQVDLNGKTNYSNTIVIKGDRVNTIKMSGLYPNPATEEITVSIDAPNAEKVVLVVTDIYGKQLMQQQISVEVGSNNTKLNVANLSSGTYLIKLQSTKTNTSSTLKFIKQ